MRIEKRGGEEYMVECPADVSACDASSDGWPCTYHLNGEHVATYPGGGDGEHRIVARWPIEPAAQLRPADEVAREMAVSRMTSRITGKTVVGLTLCGSRVHVEVDSEGEADDLRRLLARLIEQSRAEGAAAERATRPAASMGYDVQQALASVGCDRAWSDIEDAIALAYEEGQRAARVAGHPTQPRDLAETEGSTEWDTGDMSNVRALQARGIMPTDSAQPGDLAGRVRALVQEYAGRWADASRWARDTQTADAVQEEQALFDAMQLLVGIYENAANSAPIDASDVFAPRSHHNARRAAVWGRAADELEAIVRECGEAGR
jgi:hypothetical protein